MKSLMKLFTIITFAIVLIPTFNVISSPLMKNNLEELEFNQEIILPIDTSKNNAKFQPIDINIDFKNPCWAEDKKNHSIRIYCKNKNQNIEIESQIYDLEYIDTNIISSCNVVFLVPKVADGTEKYYIYYDSEKTSCPQYKDHLQISKKDYYYEPISGQKIQINCYQIEQENEIIYLSSYVGELFGFPISNLLIRLKPGAYEPRLEYLDQLCDLSINYGTTIPPHYTGSSADKDPDIRVIENGNLMIRYEIISTSPNNDLKTKNVYTYYYNPTTTKKMIVKVHHEVLKDININKDFVVQGSYAGLIRIKSKSNSIKELNIGSFLDEMYAIDSQNIVRNYEMPKNPPPDIKEIVISNKDDFILGPDSWLSLSNSDGSASQGLIINSNKEVVKNNSDGFKLSAWAEQELKLPGLEANTNNLYLMSNSKDNDLKLKKDQKVDFFVDFISTDKGYEEISSESKIFKNFLKELDFNHQEGKVEKNDIEKYNVKANVFFSFNTPFGVLINALTGRKIPYLYAELYEEEQLKSTGIVNHLPLNSLDIDLEELDIKTIIGLFDFKNISFFKKVVFPQIPSGKYVIKIYKKNPLNSKNDKFIGMKIIEVKDSDVKTNILCSQPITIKCNAVNQEGKKLDNVIFLLKKDDYLISEDFSDINGTCEFNVPFSSTDLYFLECYYDGFLVEKKEIDMKLRDLFSGIKKDFEISLSNLEVKFIDSWDLPMEVDIKPVIKSNDMVMNGFISAEKIADGKYLFEDIYQSKYVISGCYKSLEFEENIKIDKDIEIRYIFPGEFTLNLEVFNNKGQKIKKGIVLLERGGKELSLKIDKGHVLLQSPPGKYDLSVISDDKKISSQSFFINGDLEIKIVTKKDSFVHIFLFSIIWLYLKRDVYQFTNLLIISFIVLSLVFSFWSLNASLDEVSMQSKVSVFPSEMINFYESSSYFSGTFSEVPDIFYDVLDSLSILIFAIIGIYLSSFFIYKKSLKFYLFLLVINVILLACIIGIFYYTMNQITYFGLGDIIGNGTIETSLPWDSNEYLLSGNWGFSYGFYFIVLSLISTVILIFSKKFLNK